MATETPITHDRLCELLRYDPATGIFRWRVVRSQKKAGDEAGSTTERGYRVICIGYRLYRAHRLAWFYMTGAWPEAEIDHRNGDCGDNRWSNLRSATRAQNTQNSRRRCDNTSGHKNVHWIEQRQQWLVRIRVNGRRRHVGYFRHLDEAASAARGATIQLHGQFARIQ